MKVSYVKTLIANKKTAEEDLKFIKSNPSTTLQEISHKQRELLRLKEALHDAGWEMLRSFAYFVKENAPLYGGWTPTRPQNRVVLDAVEVRNKKEAFALIGTTEYVGRYSEGVVDPICILIPFDMIEDADAYKKSRKKVQRNHRVDHLKSEIIVAERVLQKAKKDLAIFIKEDV